MTGDGGVAPAEHLQEVGGQGERVGRAGGGRPALDLVGQLAGGAPDPGRAGRRRRCRRTSPPGAAKTAVGDDHRPQVGEHRPEGVLQGQRVPGGAAGRADQHRLAGERRRRSSTSKNDLNSPLYDALKIGVTAISPSAPVDRVERPRAARPAGSR